MAGPGGGKRCARRAARGGARRFASPAAPRAPSRPMTAWCRAPRSGTGENIADVYFDAEITRELDIAEFYFNVEIKIRKMFVQSSEIWSRGLRLAGGGPARDVRARRRPGLQHSQFADRPQSRCGPAGRGATILGEAWPAFCFSASSTCSDGNSLGSRVGSFVAACWRGGVSTLFEHDART